MHNAQLKVELKIPQLTQMGRHETVNTRSVHYSPRVEGSSPVRGNFLMDLFCSNTTLAELAE